MIYQKLIKLLRSPQTETRKIIPFLASQLVMERRKLWEKFKSDKYSKPYRGHEKLLKYLNQRNGFFIIAGGNDGYLSDPTYYLEKFLGWTGIIVEPLPNSLAYCRRNRSRAKIYEKALVNDKYQNQTITLVDCNAMTVVKDSFLGYEDWIKAGEIAQKIEAKEISVPVITLDKLLEEYFKDKTRRKIDLLVLDIEGYEFEALQGLNLEKYRPAFILIEIHTPERKSAIDKYLNSHYRLIENICESDYLYQSKHEH